MSKNSYARKAASFKISRPDDDASPGQIKSINWLLRSRQHSVEFGNDVVDMLSGGMTRADADLAIKHLSLCPLAKQTAQIAARSPQRPVKAQTNEPDYFAIGKAVMSGKLGKVAAKRALVI